MYKSTMHKINLKKSMKGLGWSLLTGLVISAPLHAAPASNLSTFATSWAGTFDNRKIGVFIETIQNNQVKGYSILGATKQSFAGTIQAVGQGQYKVIAKETGSPTTAGVFELNLNTNKTNEIEGSWVSNHSKIKPKFFTLKNVQCHYIADVGSFPEASTRLLKDADLQITKEDLQYMRNEIYARHHYSFANKEVAAYFAESDWYIPCNLDASKQLTSIEKENVKRIKLMEPYAKDVEWGR